jgi:cytochrome c oxidase subunit 3
VSSGVTITWSHHALIENDLKKRQSRLLITLCLGVYFTFLQGVEYTEASFAISDSAYGSRFFLATGFHGLHVLIGSVFILVALIRISYNLYSKYHHFGFEAAAWYWHFVDVVWLFLYLNLYWWRA